MKEKKTLKEMWKDPKGKIIIKLSAWGIFFVVFYLLAAIALPTASNTDDKSSTVETINFSKMKKNLINNPVSVKYKINDYYITGSITKNILVGTLEYNDSIIKIKYDNNLYQIKKEEETITNELLFDINKEYLLPSYIIELTNKTNEVNKSNDNKIYSYVVDGKAISFYIDEKEINKIIVLDNNITYELEYKGI